MVAWFSQVVSSALKCFHCTLNWTAVHFLSCTSLLSNIWIGSWEKSPSGSSWNKDQSTTHYYISTKNLTVVLSYFRHFPVACTTLCFFWNVGWFSSVIRHLSNPLLNRHLQAIASTAWPSVHQRKPSLNQRKPSLKRRYWIFLKKNHLQVVA